VAHRAIIACREDNHRLLRRQARHPLHRQEVSYLIK
jgi:hypothetical protein